MKKRYNDTTLGRGGYWAWMFFISAFNQLPRFEDGTIEITFIIMTVFVFLFVAAARCRDAGLNGWWCLATAIPFVCVYFGFIRPDDHPKKIRAIEKLRVNEPNVLDARPSSGKHQLLDIPHSKEK